MSDGILALTGLSAWSITSVLLAHRAERRLAGGAARFPLLELACTLAVTTCALVVRAPADAALRGGASIGLIAAAGADARTGYLFDAVTIPAAAVVAIFAVVSGNASSAMHGVVLLVGTFGAVLVLSRGRLIGRGDVKAMYAVGAAFGPVEALLVVFTACVSGLLVSALCGGVRRRASVAFGPHLAVGGSLTLIAGPAILRIIGGGAP